MQCGINCQLLGFAALGKSVFFKASQMSLDKGRACIKLKAMKSHRVLDSSRNASPQKTAASLNARSSSRRKLLSGAAVLGILACGALWLRPQNSSSRHSVELSARPPIVARVAPVARAVSGASGASLPVEKLSTTKAGSTETQPTTSTAKVASTTALVAPIKAQALTYSVVSATTHDAKAFTQGLLWRAGVFYESTGINGQSTLRRVEFPSGRVLDKRDLPSQYFAEGLALSNERLVQLTWTSGKAFVYDRATFKPLQTFKYEGEGWGLAFDGKVFVMSDGSATLAFRDADTFKVLRRVAVTMNGEPLKQLNELEVIDGKVWANVWQTDFIVQIDPKNGRVVSYLDLSGLHPRNGNDDVLNGIAYDAIQKRVFITGKWWSKIYQIKVDQPKL